MVKRKDYFTPIVAGTIWGIICLLLSVGIWWLVKLVTENNILAAYILAILCFCLGIYKGKEFYHVEMKTVKKDDPKTNWLSIINDIRILFLATIAINSINIFNEGFSWLGLGSSISMMIFIFLMLYLQHTRFPK